MLKLRWSSNQGIEPHVIMGCSIVGRISPAGRGAYYWQNLLTDSEPELELSLNAARFALVESITGLFHQDSVEVFPFVI